MFLSHYEPLYLHGEHASAMLQTNQTLAPERALAFFCKLCGHCRVSYMLGRGGRGEGYSGGYILQPQQLMPLNPPHWYEAVWTHAGDK